MIAEDLDGATQALAEALIQAWQVCDQLPWRHTRPDGTTYEAGVNLPEVLSVALGRASTRLAADTGEPAATVLTRHRPGCWEADHVRNLTYPVELLPGPGAGE